MGALAFWDDAKDTLMGTDAQLETKTSLSPAQQKIEKALADYFTPLIGKGVEGYTGQVVAGLTPQETEAQARIGALATQPITTLTPDITNAYKTLLSGQPSTTINADTTEQFFQQAIAQPATRRFQEETLPFLQEQFVGPGTYWGTPNIEATRKATRDFEEGLLSQRASLAYADEQARRDLMESARARQLEAGAGAVSSAVSMREAELAQQQASQQAGAVSRILEQAQLDFNISEFLRTRPEASPIIANALALLGIPTTTAAVLPGKEGILGDLLAAAGQAAGMAAVASSRTYKLDIEDNTIDTVELLKNMRIVTFRYIPEMEDSKKHIGVISEDTPDILTTNDGKAIHLGDSVGFLLDVNKKLLQRIESLEAQLNPKVEEVA